MGNSQKVQATATLYAMSLRAIGQALEALDLKSFNLEKTGDDYLIRGWTQEPARNRPFPQGEAPRAEEGGSGQSLSEKGIANADRPSAEIELRYAPEDLERLEREGQEKRCNPHEMPDGHSKSELLRAAGDYLDQREARLLGISWRDQSISIVYETAEGRRELDVFSLTSMHDFWLLMCLRREAAASQANRAPNHSHL